MREELVVRKKLNYPPFSRLILASFSSTNEMLLAQVADTWADEARRHLTTLPVHVLGPAPPLVARVKNRYRQQVLIKGRLSVEHKAELLALFVKITSQVRGGKSVGLRWDVDPEAFL